MRKAKVEDPKSSALLTLGVKFPATVPDPKIFVTTPDLARLITEALELPIQIERSDWAVAVSINTAPKLCKVRVLLVREAPPGLAVVSEIDDTPVTAPVVVTLRPPLEAREKVPVALPITVLEIPEELILAVPPETVSPPKPVSSPADVIVPEPVVEMLPELVTLSPAVAVERVVPLLVQYPTVPVAEPVIFPLQVKLPLELVTLQPVDPEPPPIRTSPVETLPIFIVPVPFASRLRVALSVAKEIDGLAPVRLIFPASVNLIFSTPAGSKTKSSAPAVAAV